MSSAAERRGAAVLWFKHDLRVDDHPGLAAAAKFETVVPLYIFDRRIFSRFSEEMLELLLFAVEDLRNSLKKQGSDLMIRSGDAENVIQELVEEVKATSIFAEEEVEYEVCGVVDAVKEALTKASSLERSPSFIEWNAPLYNIKNVKELPVSYNEFEKLKYPTVSPVPSAKLPSLKVDSNYGSIPTLDDLKNVVNEYIGESKQSWISIKKISAETVLRKDKSVSLGQQFNGLDVQKRRPESVFVTKSANIVGGGTTLVLNALAAYLRYLEGTARYDWQEVHAKLRDTESREGASFGNLFGSALSLGIISRRRALYEAIKYEKERNGGFLSPFGYSAATIAAVANTVCSMEWYWLLASKTQCMGRRLQDIQIWRWKGYLVEYTTTGDKGPAVLLVHGFGAFLEHYRDNIKALADGGSRVWAVTLLGFGRSEKPNVVYTEIMWAEFIRDFIVDVVGEPMHLVGNSIGGYIVSIVAGLWPEVAKSIVLINSAGNIVPQYYSLPFSKERQTSSAAWLGSRALLLYLRLRIKNIVKNCYPTKVERADDQIIDEMLRASYDPGVVVVLESVFTFDLSVPLNYLLKDFSNRVLAIQGMKDPISNSKSKIALFKEHFRGIVIKELDAG